MAHLFDLPGCHHGQPPCFPGFFTQALLNGVVLGKFLMPVGASQRPALAINRKTTDPLNAIWRIPTRSSRISSKGRRKI
jgi:hypothetical protein